MPIPFRIIPALSSRCARFEFGSLPREHVVDRLRFISDQEQMTIDNDVCSRLRHHD